MLRFSVFLGVALTLSSGCLGGDKPDTGADTGDTAGPVCAGSLEEFCEMEFGGPCPSFDGAAALMCDGVHFSPTGSSTPWTDYDGDATCPNPQAFCADEEGMSTALYFETGSSGRLEGVILNWPDTEECSGYRTYGYLSC